MWLVPSVVLVSWHRLAVISCHFSNIQCVLAVTPSWFTQFYFSLVIAKGFSSYQLSFKLLKWHVQVNLKDSRPSIVSTASFLYVKNWLTIVNRNDYSIRSNVDCLRLTTAFCQEPAVSIRCPNQQNTNSYMPLPDTASSPNCLSALPWHKGKKFPKSAQSNGTACYCSCKITASTRAHSTVRDLRAPQRIKQRVGHVDGV